MQTYRYRGHSMSDPAKYRSKDEVQKMREERDPIEQVRKRLLEQWGFKEDELKAAQRTVRDLARRHAIPTATYQSWQARLTALVATAHQKAG